MHTQGDGPTAAGQPPTTPAQHLDAARKLSGGEAVASLAEAFRAGHLQLTADFQLPGGWKVGPASKEDPGILRVMLPEGRGGFAVFHHDHPLAQRGRVTYETTSDRAPNNGLFPDKSPLADTYAPQVDLRKETDPNALKGGSS